MSEFWGYPYADVLALVIISALSLGSLICAWIYVKNY
ncbi:hypothetical protein LCGC14_0539050 [marine sediment metagenome]|uniref:Uncharacterized protein n=1 Tax=marine sediment metagenome TaxID=412755 RepID=A0A0F9RTF7_9ZZZZ